MHKSFYASGFLYRPQSQQILLQQLNESVSQWSLFGGKSGKFSDPPSVIKYIVEDQIGIKLNVNKIKAVYDYFHEELKEDYYILYAEVGESTKKFKLKNCHSVAWFTFKQLHKLPLTAQTKQDIIVGERVINAINRNLNIPQEETELVDKS